MPNYALVSTAALVAAGALYWLSRVWIKRYVEKSVDASFDRKLEVLRSDLRTKEAQITALQAAALNNRAGRDSIIEKRRIEAVEGIWGATIKLRSFKMAAVTFNIFKMDMLSKRAEQDERVRAMIGMVAGVSDESLKSLGEVGGDSERLFLPVDAWATYTALRSILVYVYARLLAIKNGVSDSEKLMHGDHVVKVVRAALPSHESFIDQYGINGIGHLVEPLEELVFTQLQRALHGEEADSLAVERSANVLRLAKEAQIHAANAAVARAETPHAP